MSPAHAAGERPAHGPLDLHGPVVPVHRPRLLALAALLCGLVAIGSALVPVATGEAAIGARIAAVVLVALGAVLAGLGHARTRPDAPLWRVAALLALWTVFGLAVGLFALVVA